LILLRSARMRRICFFALILMLAAACGRYEAKPADTGNATDRSPVNGTSGTGTPADVDTAAAGAAQSLDTAGATTGTPIGVSGTEDVHAAKTETTATIVTPTTTTAAIETPTDTSATVKSTTGTKTGRLRKH